MCAHMWWHIAGVHITWVTHAITKSYNLKELKGQSRILHWLALSQPKKHFHAAVSVPEQCVFSHKIVFWWKILLAGISWHQNFPECTLIFHNQKLTTTEWIALVTSFHSSSFPLLLWWLWSKLCSKVHMAHGTRRGVPCWSWPAVLVLCLTRNHAILRWPSKDAKWGGVNLHWSWPAALALRLARNYAMLRWPLKDAKWSSGATAQGGLEAEGPNKKNSLSSNKRGLCSKVCPCMSVSALHANVTIQVGWSTGATY